jgi:hypothetical protein
MWTRKIYFSDRGLFPIPRIKEAIEKYPLNASGKANRKPCPQCGRKSEELTWCAYQTDDHAFDLGYGARGPLGVCVNCKKYKYYVVYFDCSQYPSGTDPKSITSPLELLTW